MLKKIFFILLAMLMCIAIGVDAQQYVELHGVVKDSVADEPVPYASVFVKGTGEGAIANVKGEFSVSIPLNSVLKVQVVGYETNKNRRNSPFSRIFRKNRCNGRTIFIRAMVCKNERP